MPTKQPPRLKTRRRQGRHTIPWLPVIILFLCIICIVWVFRYSVIEAEKTQRYLSILSNQALVSQQMAAHATQSMLLDKPSNFEQLQSLRDQFIEDFIELKSLDPEISTLYATELSQLEQTWEHYRDKVDMILFGQRILADTQKHTQSIRETIPTLQNASEQIAKNLLKQDVPSRQIMLASQQSMLIQRIDNNLNQVMFGAQAIDTATKQFAADAKRFGQVINGMVLGDRQLGLDVVDNAALRSKMQQVANQFREVSEEVSTILDVAPALRKLMNASQSLQVQARDLLKVSRDLQRKVDLEGRSLRLWNLLGLFFGLLALLSAIWLGFSLFWQARQQWRQAKQEHDKQQAAIMQLLDEMDTLAEGNLTMKATVSESITGAIADSVNYAVEALRNLVVKINNTSGKLTEYANNTNDTVQQLLNASNSQDREITQATGLIVDVTDSIRQVSQNASSSADVAKKSLAISRNGAQQIRHTISGMDAVREQIQGTSKRIKRLSESSQEVGNIMHLMNDITEQTKVLALNAAIFSSSHKTREGYGGFQASEQNGQNFSHLADEVQQLAQDAGQATRKVELLVKTMLTDTKEAVTSMEMTTSNVVEGANNAEIAKSALNEIETVFAQLARLIANISVAAEQQAAKTHKVHQAMRNIQEMTCQTNEKVEETSHFIRKLNQTTAELRESIYGFVLP